MEITNKVLSKKELDLILSKCAGHDDQVFQVKRNLNAIWMSEDIKAKRILVHAPFITYSLTKALRIKLLTRYLSPKFFFLLALSEKDLDSDVIRSVIQFLKVSRELGIPLSKALQKFMRGRERVLIRFLKLNKKEGFQSLLLTTSLREEVIFPKVGVNPSIFIRHAENAGKLKDYGVKDKNNAIREVISGKKAYFTLLFPEVALIEIAKKSSSLWELSNFYLRGKKLKRFKSGEHVVRKWLYLQQAQAIKSD